MFTAKRKYTMEKLSRDIHMKREEMIHLGLTYGLTNKETVQVSQELDKLIVKYQRYKEKQSSRWLFFTKIPIFQIEWGAKSNDFWKILVTGFMK
ncbi:Spo0E family sporulation regulatory protein-aspartic acid phosphatase [Bacillus cytotoxicus]|uniref:Stage 0 sporulation regulatory protein n=2 Tax=Bacillus cytotoxicus TaxID=580165 RepID=A0AAX2CE86_9BACI|nr:MULTISPECIES: aspartyl-phosphate phosphatase Spo0E family protein [Bacillus cereus group]ABS21384.1 stage 0 sporulation regulatory protein [Bacillus cytotoxicus NVH 391-98]AWC28030.1 aspartyl-phosphate phosphatase Spo0E family protein [Bacillus cytotoxicus]AWC32064.1 aspartyl-phosphate phosphatase Spo0E family protein [Bacillus cytotoxicus]AWC36093.1 aspartyl-phosphate phosphatase Spo0E family protein [Bacillus cytotoxicus]AWC40588.1 aspartyl-phosphate phosphatase Spo0E family protein [Baci